MAKQVGLTTLVDLVRMRASEQPNRPAFTFLADEQATTFTYGELDRRARALGAVLQSVSKPGERALLLYPPGHDYLIAFFGCLYAGILAVPAYPPRLNGSLDRLQAVVQDAQATLALTTTAIRSKVEHRFADTKGLQGLTWLDTEQVSDRVAENWEYRTLGAEHLAFLQYTSGSTSTPKGVMLSHGNLMSNLDLIQESFGTTEQSDAVIWLPPYHDMGLIGGILQPLYAGFHATLMSPFAFMQRPLLWLEEITKRQARVSGGPNFAYDLCVQKITDEQKAGLDLSSWDVAFTGAEPIRSETLDRFVAAFADCGFRREAFYPCYGLAEATLFVTGGVQTEQPIVQGFDPTALEENRVQEIAPEQASARLLVSSGRARRAKQRVEVVDPMNGVPCAEDQVGEIWVAGASVALGYWQRPEQTRETFGARLANGEGPFLRTGDLGFMRGGELFVTGRLKDLIIVRGRNYYPQDIEYTMQESHVALRPGCGAAFTVEVDGEERVVVVQEIERQHRKADLEEVVACIRQAVAEEHQLTLHAVVLIRPATAPLTSSGKIQRHACRERYLQGTLDVMKAHVFGEEVVGLEAVESDVLVMAEEDLNRELLMQMTPDERRSAVERHLQSKAARILRMERVVVDVQKPLGAFGLDSLMAVEFKDALEESVGVVLPLVTFLEGPSIAQVAEEIVARLDAGQLETSMKQEMSSTSSALSYGQRALWFMQRLTPDNAAYNIAHAVRIPGALHVEALSTAFGKVVQRHPQLRTTFPTHEEQPIHVVQGEVGNEGRFADHPNYNKQDASNGDKDQQLEHVVNDYQIANHFDFHIQDVSDWDEATLQEHLTQLAHTPFDLEKGHLLRVHLFSRAAEEHILLLTVHHIVVDFWSLGVLIDELQQIYTAEVQGTDCALEAPRASYAEHVAWQQNLISSTDGEQLLAYWKEQLRGDLPILHVPTDRPRPPVQTYRGALHSFALNAELTARLKEIAHQEGVTLYMALLSLYQAFLHRYTGQEDILVGSPTAGRNSAKYRDVIGYFVNPVVLRAHFTEGLSFTDFLAQVRHTVLGALQHQEYPFPLLVEQLQPKRDPSFSPLFQTMFVLQKSHVLDDQGLTAFALSESGAKMSAGELTFEAVTIEQRAAQFDLTLSMAEVDGAIVASFAYNTDLFDSTTIERMAGHFQTLTASLLADPHACLTAAPLLTAVEKQRLLNDWNDTATDVNLEQCLHHVFEQQVEQTPDHIAVAFADKQVTYRELNERANRLAHLLRDLGVGTDVAVGICTERSVEMIVGLLGILKAGGAYVPLDPAHPAERLRYMLEDAGANVLLTQKQLAHLIPEHQTHTLYLDADEATQELLAQPTHNLHVEMTSDHLAYIIYTSGTTGKPKGVCVPHRGVLNMLFDMERRRSLVAGDGCIVFTSFGFDVSAYEMFAALLFGGRLHPVPEALRTDVPAFFRWLEANDIRCAYLPAFLLQDFVHALRAGKVTLNMHRILVGVEPIPEPLLAEIAALQPEATILNGYGPTETSIAATLYPVHAGTARDRNAPIGKPLDNLRAYVLDSKGQPVPIGVAGELYVGGVAVVRGYLNRPELTAEKFLPSPFVQGDRLYKTGDLVRYNAQGDIEFIGRVDQQIKLRGFRIELGEIEVLLAEQPDVNDVVVTAREDARGEKQLVAYVIPEMGATLTAHDLREKLQAHLPSYMVPSSFVFLDAFPLTPNGKIDMRALPAPVQTRELEQAYVAPRTSVEEVVAGIWSEVLRVERISVEEDFFALGGHSLLATQIISRINAAFQVEIPLAKLFERPTIAGLASAVEQAVQCETVSKGLLVQRDDSMSSNADHYELPLSFAQERMWFFEQFQAGTATYNMPGAVRLTGRLDVSALERSLQTIWNRHEVLRMNFSVVDDQAVGMVHETNRFTLSAQDLRDVPLAQKEAEVQRLAQVEAKKPFDLTNDALVRTTLLQLGDEEFVLLLTLHHIVSDGWSIGIFVRELAVLYTAFVQGNEHLAQELLPTLDIQYADFANWQREWLSGDVLQSQMSYWREKLSGDLPVLQLPTDRPRPAVQTFNGSSVPVKLPASLADGLQQLSKNEGVTLYMTLLGAFQTLLYRYTGQDDLLIGSPIAGRNQVEIEQLIGLFVNTLVLRTDLSGEPTFHELLGRVRKVALEAYAHQEVPFEKLVEEIQPTRSMTHSPLFQVMFVLQNTPISALELPGLSLQVSETETSTAKFDLTLNLTEGEDGLEGLFEYNTDLFDRATIERMVGHFHRLLEAVVAQPQQAISRLPMLTEAERTQLLVEWNETDAAYPHDACLHQLFEAQALRLPDAPAVVYREQQISYGELNRRANQLAHRLRRIGVGADVLVGICMERSVEMVVAVFGILKAGGAYVPLDATYPQERLAFLLSDSQVQVVLTQERLLGKLRGLDEVGQGMEVQHVAEKPTFICLEPDLHTLDGEPETTPDVALTPDHLAYVIYTSGTTGQPKGALLPHRGVVNLMTDFNNRKPVVPGEGCAAWSNFGFDLSVMELFGALLFGGRLHLLPDDMRADSLGYFRWLATSDIRNAYLPPFMHKDLVHHLQSEKERSLHLQRIMVGVESIHEPLLAEVCALLPEVTIINAYGPTEASICATLYTFDPSHVQERNTPIGTPVQNTHVYLLDAHLQPVPIGVAGELHTGGVHVARGYLNRPELTVEKFISSPFVEGERLYKTGDMARYLPDGTIEYIARRDNQIKLRGFRIELGEIETVLIQHPAVRETVVLVQELGNTKTLVAYLVTDAAQEISSGEMRQFLKDKLPDYMVPSAFVWLDAMPLTPNGKIDRRAMPAPEASLLQRTEYVAPRTQAEELLASIFSEVLGVEQVGAHDNFFELGGHSLLATQVVSRIRTHFHVELPLRAIFETGTVAELAVAVDVSQEEQHAQESNGNQQLTTTDEPPLVILPREEHRVQRISGAASSSFANGSGHAAGTDAYAFPLSFAQQRLWFLEQFMPGNTSYNIPVAVRLQGELNVAALEYALSETVKRHEALRTTFAMLGEQPMQIIADEMSLSLPVIALREFPVEDREGLALQLALEEAKSSFDLTQGPLVRTTLLRLREHEHVLLLTMHHIVSDGWSMGVFIQEIAALYEAHLTGKPAALSLLPVQYADFADWQQKWLAGGVLESQLAYWKRKLAGRLPVLQLPSDRSRPAVQSFVGANLPIQFSVEMTQQLKALAKQEGVTLYMTLLAAFKTLLYRYTGQEDILVGSPIANRVREEIEGLIGFFVNTLVLRTDLSGGLSFRDLLARVREVSLEAYAHQDVPFEKLVEELQPERDLSHTPLFQVMFILQNAPMGAMELPGLSLHPLATDNGTSKFDLTLSLNETAEGTLAGSLEYSTDLFDETTMQRLFSHLQNVLEGVLADPSLALTDIPLLTDRERQELLVEWNDTGVTNPEGLCAPHLFERQVERTPDAIALMVGEDYLTYGELNQLSNQVAHHLQTLGVQPDVCVGLCMERSLEMVIGLLAIHKAGGAYVSLDPAYPQDRLAFMVEESRISVLVTQSHLTSVLPVADVQMKIVALDTAWEEIAACSGENPVSGVTPDHLGYVLYTSGSTGKPKGVAMGHGPLANLIQWQLADSVAGVGTKTLQFASLNFDVSFQEIMSTLASGGTLVVAQEQLRKDPVQMLHFLQDQRIERLFLPFVALQQLAEAADGGAPIPSSLREIVTAGEQLQITRQIASWLKKMPTCTLTNHYGPSETHVVTSYRLAGDVEQWQALPPIGRPIANAKTYILDGNRQPVPIGVAGELFIGGDVLARGYLGRDDLTAERFIQNPFADDPQERLYKTGDLALYLPDGNIKYMGRIDQQVKVRGFRIELGEIEEVLTQHPAVQEAVAIAREDVPGEKLLVAYVVTDSTETLTVSALRSFLQEKLPDYMVPSMYLFLDKLPLTPSGKVDRLALPKPENNRPDLQVAYVAPETDLERTIAAVWQEVLRVEQVGVHDNFFDLGGHSLLIVQVHNKLRERLGVELTVVQLFQYPTVAALADYLSQDHSGTSSAVQQSQNRAENRRESRGRRDARAKQRSQIKKGERIDE